MSWYVDISFRIMYLNIADGQFVVPIIRVRKEVGFKITIYFIFRQ